MRINQAHADVTVTAFQIHVHMAHRIGALLLFGTSLWITSQVVQTLGASSGFARGVMGWQGLILAQALLGAATVWTGKAADIATIHVVVGAACLVSGLLLSLVAARLSEAPVGSAASAKGQGIPRAQAGPRSAALATTPP